MTETRARSTQPSSDSKRRILIVDDEPSIVRMLAEMLQQDGYICSGCQSGKEASALARNDPPLLIRNDPPTFRLTAPWAY